ncbi:MAG TPA: glycoside hydrolase family 88 protein [Opitutaceae bacterium]|nr:glycoside hydrolase family 88 protein [Opitutaceae bacterium]
MNRTMPNRFLALFALTVTCAFSQALPATFSDATPLTWSQRIADSEIGRRGESLTYKEGGRAKWDYAAAFFELSLFKLTGVTQETRYADYATKSLSSFITPEGGIHTFKVEDYNLDNIPGGRVLLNIYAKTKDERYKKAADRLIDQLAHQPRTSDGGFWHKQRYPYQMWLDGLFMGEPFAAHYAKTFHQPEHFSEVAKQIILMDRHAYDPKTSLYYHGWDESRKESWANKETGTSPNFWSRGIGWYAMALVDTLDVLPADLPERPQLMDILKRVAKGIERYQDPKSGVWWQVTDQGDRKGNYLETTGSSMFVYALTKAVNHGWLDRDQTLPVITKGYAGILHEFVKPDDKGGWQLIQCCSVAGLSYGRDGSFEYYIHEPIVSNDLKGVAPFILAGIEMQKLVSPKSANAPAHLSGTPTPGWEKMAVVLSRIQAPKFAERDFKITDYGAKADGSLATAAIRQAIEACSKAGGGRVVVPEGTFSTGAIHLLSGVNLHLRAGATLKFSANPADFLPIVMTRFEGIECFNYSPLIYAFEQRDIAITGEGTLDGSASEENWWGWTKRGKSKQRGDTKALGEMGAKGVPVEDRKFGEGHFLRPAFIQPYRCQNILIEGVKIRNSPMWEINPVLSKNITVRNVDILSHGPNNDGCDPESCEDVLIEGCTFDTGDDCIAIKSGRNDDGRRVGVASSNLVIRNCVMKDGHGGVVIGSEVAGGCHDVFVEDCQMDSPNLDRALRLKSNAMRGGVIENVFMRRVQVGRVKEAILTVDFLYEEGPNGKYSPTARNIVIEQVTSKSTPRVLYIAGFPAATIDNILLKDCTFSGVETADLVEYAGKITFDHVRIESAKKTESLNRRAM